MGPGIYMRLAIIWDVMVSVDEYDLFLWFLVAQEKDFHDDTLGFHPEFTHQIFGEKWVPLVKKTNVTHSCQQRCNTKYSS